MQTIVGAGQSVTGLTVNTGDLAAINDTDGTSTYGFANGPTGGTANYSIINGGELYLNYGLANQTVVHAGGELVVDAGGLAINTVLDGGRLVLYNENSAQADHTIINAGGALNGDGTTHDTTINFGGEYDLSDNNPSAVHSGITVNDGGTLIISPSYAAYSDLHVASGGHIIASVPYGENTQSFDTTTNTLNITYQTTTYSGNSASTETNTFSIHLTGDYSTKAFVLSDAQGVVSVTAESVCFCRGTLIQTSNGDVPIESLAVGDVVLTAGGPPRTISWIGSATALVTESNRPVRIRRGAFGDGSPTQDLYVTRGHSFLFGQVLIPIGNLVNDSSIAWDMNARTLSVVHIELDVHAILVANGALAESYRDDGNRARFAQPSRSGRFAGTMPTYAPIVVEGPLIERTRRHLDRVAAALPDAAFAGADKRAA